MNIVLLGAPGSGKGTLAISLEKHLGIKHISTGDMLREEIAKRTPMGLSLKEIIESGKLVQDSQMVELIRRVSEELKGGMILDGFPRTLEQSVSLSEIMEVHRVIYLEVSDDILMRRLTGRRSCLNCKKIYNIYLSPSQKGDRCEVCDHELSMREDDIDEKIVNNRISIFKEKTLPVVDYWKKEEKLLKVDGNHRSQNIVQGVLDSLSS